MGRRNQGGKKEKNTELRVERKFCSSVEKKETGQRGGVCPDWAQKIQFDCEGRGKADSNRGQKRRFAKVRKGGNVGRGLLDC